MSERIHKRPGNSGIQLPSFSSFSSAQSGPDSARPSLAGYPPQYGYNAPVIPALTAVPAIPAKQPRQWEYHSLSQDPLLQQGVAGRSYLDGQLKYQETPSVQSVVPPVQPVPPHAPSTTQRFHPIEVVDAISSHAVTTSSTVASSEHGDEFYQSKFNLNEKCSSAISGPPRTSRFYRFFTPETRHGVGSPVMAQTVTAAASTSTSAKNLTHHYNPYIYPQNRNRVNPPPDFLSDVRSADADAALSQAPMIPVLRPTPDQFKDPISYIESVRSLGEKYGAVKIVPPDQYCQSFAANLESLWFKTRRQLWNSPDNELNSRYEFWQRLEGGKSALTKLPCIDKRPIDLWRLHRSVQLRGGFQSCCGEKMWAQVGRELGFYGKITSSLSSSIKSAYIRYVLPLGLEDQKSLSNFEVRDYIGEAEDGTPRKRRRLFKVTGSSVVFPRARNTLVHVGYDAYFDQDTTQKRSITVNDSQTLPQYDFYNWHGDTAVDDTSPYQTRVSSLYNIRQCNEKSKALKRMTLEALDVPDGDRRADDAQFLEAAFWRILGQPGSALETEAALRVSTKIHESGFGSRPVRDTVSTLLSPWNLHNLPICRGSMLQYLQEDADSVMTPRLSFGMFYSVQSWTIEDHWLFNAEYQHMGDRRLCYFIPAAYRTRYEELLRQFLHLKNDETSQLSHSYDKFAQMVRNGDAYATAVENRVLSDEMVGRAPARNGKFASLMQEPGEPCRLNQDILLPPEFLRAQGIQVYGCFQEPGDFIVKFPATYGMSVSLGMSVSESVNFATPSWLGYSETALGWLQSQWIPPAFSNFRLLINISRQCKEKSVLQQLQGILESRVAQELQHRETVRRWQLKESVADAGHCGVTDADLLDSFPTYVELSDKGETFTMSLASFVKSHSALPDVKGCMKCCMNDEALRDVVVQLKLRLMTGDEWLRQYEAAITNYDKPPVKLLKKLVADGEVVLGADNVSSEGKSTALKVLENLKREVAAAESWTARASKFLQYRISLRRQQGKAEESIRERWNSVEELSSLLDEISRLSASTPEMDQLEEFSAEIVNFNRQVQTELRDGNPENLTKLRNLHLLGQTFGVKLDSFFLLDRILKRRGWLGEYEHARRNPEDYDMQGLISEGIKVGSSADAAKIDDLKQIVKRAEAAEQRARQFTERRVAACVSGVALQQCYDDVKTLPISSEVMRQLTDMVDEYYSVKRWLENVREALDVPQHHHSLLLVNMEEVSDFLSRASIYLELGELARRVRDEGLMPLRAYYSELYRDFPFLPADEKDLEQYFSEAVATDKAVFQEKPENNNNYCVCRSGNEDDAMIECESCKEWFHFKCIGLENESKLGQLGFLCPICDYENRLATTKFHDETMAGKPDVVKLGKLASWGQQNLRLVTKVVQLADQLCQDAEQFHTQYALQVYKDGVVVLDRGIVRFVLRQLGGAAVNFLQDRRLLKQSLRV